MYFLLVVREDTSGLLVLGVILGSIFGYLFTVSMLVSAMPDQSWPDGDKGWAWPFVIWYIMGKAAGTRLRRRVPEARVVQVKKD